MRATRQTSSAGGYLRYMYVVACADEPPAATAGQSPPTHPGIVSRKEVASKNPVCTPNAPQAWVMLKFPVGRPIGENIEQLESFPASHRSTSGASGEVQLDRLSALVPPKFESRRWWDHLLYRPGTSDSPLGLTPDSLPSPRTTSSMEPALRAAFADSKIAESRAIFRLVGTPNVPFVGATFSPLTPKA
jgi:hypothetical protein